MLVDLCSAAHDSRFLSAVHHPNFQSFQVLNITSLPSPQARCDVFVSNIYPDVNSRNRNLRPEMPNHRFLRTHAKSNKSTFLVSLVPNLSIYLDTNGLSSRITNQTNLRAQAYSQTELLSRFRVRVTLHDSHHTALQTNRCCYRRSRRQKSPSLNPACPSSSPTNALQLLFLFLPLFFYFHLDFLYLVRTLNCGSYKPSL